MRLWTIHPRYLDTKGLVAAWREGLLAQKVLRGQTRGYTRHPQLRRFQTSTSPIGAIAGYLMEIANEGDRRGYKFDRSKIFPDGSRESLIETRGQLLFEWSHLKRKLRRRSPKIYRACCRIDRPRPHPLFRIVAGPIQEWERTNSQKRTISRALQKRRRERGGKPDGPFGS